MSTEASAVPREVEFAAGPAYRWVVGGSEFVAAPERGARLVGWRRRFDGGSSRKLLHWPDDAEGRDFGATRGGNPILFPFCARTFANGRIHRWRASDGMERPMPLHGLARQAAFRLTRLDAAGFRAEMLPGAEAHEAYPYPYCFEVEYEFRPDGFNVELALTNLGHVPLLWSAGHHFYFRVPWREDRKRTRADYSISLQAGRVWCQDALGRLEPLPLAPTEEPLTSSRLIAAMHGELRSAVCSLTDRLSGECITVAMPGARTRFPGAVFTTWTEDSAAPYFCVEPWMGPANAVEHGTGLDRVLPGDRRIFPVVVRHSAS